MTTCAMLRGMSLSKPEPKMSKKYAGRLGGLKGGQARAESLSPERRSEIAKKAAEARWKSSEETQKEKPDGYNM